MLYGGPGPCTHAQRHRHVSAATGIIHQAVAGAAAHLQLHTQGKLQRLGRGAKGQAMLHVGEPAGTGGAGRRRKNTSQRKQASEHSLAPHSSLVYHRVPKGLASTPVPMVAVTSGPRPHTCSSTWGLLLLHLARCSNSPHPNHGVLVNVKARIVARWRCWLARWEDGGIVTAARRWRVLMVDVSLCVA